MKMSWQATPNLMRRVMKENRTSHKIESQGKLDEEWLHHNGKIRDYVIFMPKIYKN